MFNFLPKSTVYPYPIQITRHTLKPSQSSHHFSLKTPAKPKSIHLRLPPPKSDQNPSIQAQTKTQDDGIPIDDVKIIAKFKTRHNYIRVLEVSRRADHPFSGSRLLLLGSPGNIHSISFLFKSLTNTYFDVGAGSTARLMLELYPELIIHGWELDPSVVAVGREHFGLGKLEKQYPDRLYIYIGNALKASIKNGFAGILVDLFSKGSLIPELLESGSEHVAEVEEESEKRRENHGECRG